MKKTKMFLIALSAFLIGCVSVQIAKFVVPPLGASQQNLPKWEYYCFKGYVWGSGPISPDEVMEKSNALGQQGWEMVSGDASGAYCFKRQL